MDDSISLSDAEDGNTSQKLQYIYMLSVVNSFWRTLEGSSKRIEEMQEACRVGKA